MSGKDGVEASCRATEDQLVAGRVAFAEMCGWMACRAVFLAVTFREEPNFAETVEHSLSSSGRSRCLLASGHSSQAFLTAETRSAAMVARLRSWEALGGRCRSLMMIRTAPATWEAEASGTDAKPSERERMSWVLVCGACSRNCSHVGRVLPGAASAGACGGACGGWGAAAGMVADLALASATASTVRTVGKVMEPSRSRERNS